MPTNKSIRIVFVLMLLACTGRAQLKTATVFADHMVLQRDMKVPVWGNAKPGVTVNVSFNHKNFKAVADAHGNWKVYLDAMPANTNGQSLTISSPGENDLVLKDVLVGEVWLCSGQSNMRMEMMYREETIAGVVDWQNEVKKANYPLIRLYNRFRKKGAEPWEICDSVAVKLFSAVAYYFGADLFNELKVPIGLIHESAGGTSIQKWIPGDYFAELPWAKQYLDYSQVIPWADPGICYKNFIAPVKGYGIRGAIWYQGESNSNNDVHGYSYRYMLPLLIKSWRKEWGQNEFPFAFVQLPIFDNSKAFRYVREAELETFKTVSNTGIVVSYDNVEQRHLLHPGTKKYIGERLALWAKSSVYKKNAAPLLSPVYQKHERAGSTIKIYFSNAEKLQTAEAGVLKGFSIAAADGEFRPAKAIVGGKNIISVSSDEVKEPMHVRYTWGEKIEPGNLVNENKLPAAAFRTDTLGNAALERSLVQGGELHLIKLNDHYIADAKALNDWMPAPQPAITNLKGNSVTIATNRVGRGGIQSPYLLNVDMSKNPVIKLGNLKLGSAAGWSLMLITAAKDQYMLKENAKETGDISIVIAEHAKNMNGGHDFVILLYANGGRRASLDIDNIELTYQKK